MAEIILRDGTTYEVEEGSIPQELVILVKDVDEFGSVYKTMTDENLSEFEMVEDGKATGTYKSFLCQSATFTENKAIFDLEPSGSGENPSLIILTDDYSEAGKILLGEED